MVSDGAHDSLLLEWTGGPENVTSWQYRQRRWKDMQPLEWEAWTDIPNSDSATRGYRLAGLRGETAYDYEVRAIVGTAVGERSALAEGTTHQQGGIPTIDPNQIVEGDGSTVWRVRRLGFAFAIPDGMRLQGGAVAATATLRLVVMDVVDTRSGSTLVFQIGGHEYDREIKAPAGSPPRDVNALFDQILASVSHPPTEELTGFSAAGPRTPPGPELIVVSYAAHDFLLLEWTGGPENATSWQYRQRRWENYRPLAWQAWTDIPNSGASTRSYRLTGLSADSAYEFQVRAVVGVVTGAGSEIARAITHPQGSAPQLTPDRVVEGDGRTEWYVASFVITIPEGMRIVGGRYFNPACLADVTPCGPGVSLRDFATGSYLSFTLDGREMTRRIVEQAGSQAHDVDALFDQLVASVRHPQLDGLVPSLRQLPADGETGPGIPDAQTPPPPDLVVVSDGSHDTLLLEWTGGPEHATKWQYRQRRWEELQPLAWGAWTDIPNSDAATRSYRVTGLSAHTAYDYQVRAAVATVEGAPSRVSQTGSTHREDDLPRLRQGQIVEGDGVREWRLGNLAFTMPDGMRLIAEIPSVTGDGEASMPVSYFGRRGGLRFSPDGDASLWHRSNEPDVGALLLQVRASARVLE